MAVAAIELTDIAFADNFVFDSGDPDLPKTILRALDPHKVDLVVDSVAGPQFQQAVALGC